MATPKYDILITQGATFVLRFNYLDSNRDPITLNEYTAKMQIRKDYNSPVILELSTENGAIELDNPEGRIRVEISALDTKKLSFDKGIYDLELYKDDYIGRFIQGEVRLCKEVTR